jgi:hypothetical protein
MTVTITFSNLLSNLLQQKAKRLQISVEELATRLLEEALMHESVDTSALATEEDSASLEALVAKIKAGPEGASKGSPRWAPSDSNGFEQGEKVGDKAYIEYLLANPPKGTVTAEEWERLWPQIEEELKALDPLEPTFSEQSMASV